MKEDTEIEKDKRKRGMKSIHFRYTFLLLKRIEKEKEVLEEIKGRRAEITIEGVERYKDVKT